IDVGGTVPHSLRIGDSPLLESRRHGQPGNTGGREVRDVTGRHRQAVNDRGRGDERVPLPAVIGDMQLRCAPGSLQVDGQDPYAKAPITRWSSHCRGFSRSVGCVCRDRLRLGEGRRDLEETVGAAGVVTALGALRPTVGELRPDGPRPATTPTGGDRAGHSAMASRRADQTPAGQCTRGLNIMN
ncbi:MAG: hypothetical protein QOK15_2634, partial [Nocardioidaceae bacterium]|nr:hypothetical protein [Nocardioidaceae bacterium]